MAPEEKLFNAHLSSDLVSPAGVQLRFGVQALRLVRGSPYVAWDQSAEGTGKRLVKVCARRTSAASGQLVLLEAGRRSSQQDSSDVTLHL